MNRLECEKKVEALIREAYETYKQYNPDGDFFSIGIIEGHAAVFNSWFDQDKERPINFWFRVDEKEEDTQ